MQRNRESRNQKCYISRRLYKCLFSKEKQYRLMSIIRSHKHELYTEEVNKVALSADDDKRHVLQDGIHTVLHGHCRYIRWLMDIAV